MAPVSVPKRTSAPGIAAFTATHELAMRESVAVSSQLSSRESKENVPPAWPRREMTTGPMEATGNATMAT